MIYVGNAKVLTISPGVNDASSLSSRDGVSMLRQKLATSAAPLQALRKVHWPSLQHAKYEDRRKVMIHDGTSSCMEPFLTISLVKQRLGHFAVLPTSKSGL